MRIGGYLPTTLLDWPGKVAAETWTVGCNFRCPFCHNGDLVRGKVEEIDETEILADLKERKKWLDGLVIGGGEPTLQTDLVKFCERVKKMGLEIKLDTNGSRPEVLKELIEKGLIDSVAMDVKTSLLEYRKVAKVRDELITKIEESWQILRKWGGEVELRTTVVPRFHNSRVLKEMGEWLEREVPKEWPWVWQKFISKRCLDIRLNREASYSRSEIKKIKKVVKRKVKLRGW